MRRAWTAEESRLPEPGVSETPLWGGNRAFSSWENNAYTAAPLTTPRVQSRAVFSFFSHHWPFLPMAGSTFLHVF